jgi:citrate synthase
MADLIEVPPGLKGVAAAETAIGNVRGEEGFYHYLQYDATELARTRTFEEVWYLLRSGALPEAG